MWFGFFFSPIASWWPALVKLRVVLQTKLLRTVTKAPYRRYPNGAVLELPDKFNCSTDLPDRAAWTSLVLNAVLCFLPQLSPSLESFLSLALGDGWSRTWLQMQPSCEWWGWPPSVLLTAAPIVPNSGITVLNRNVRETNLATSKCCNFSQNLKNYPHC